MIELNIIGGHKITINAEMIKWIKARGCTTSLTLINDDKMIIEDSVDEVIEKVIKYKRSIYCPNFENI